MTKSQRVKAQGSRGKVQGQRAKERPKIPISKSQTTNCQQLALSHQPRYKFTMLRAAAQVIELAGRPRQIVDAALPPASFVNSKLIRLRLRRRPFRLIVERPTE